MKDVVFTSVCFGEKYCEQQLRLKKSILEIYPEANLNFYYDRVPASSKLMTESLYGFKVHAIKESRTHGFNKIIWLDPAMILVDKIDRFLNYPMIAIKDDNKLCDLISQKALDFYNTKRETIQILDWHLVGGSFYYFDFGFMKAHKVFKMWMESEEAGLFGSQHEAASEQINGHRNDESMMALAMYFNEVEPLQAFKVGYCTQNDPIFIKKHFK